MPILVALSQEIVNRFGGYAASACLPRKWGVSLSPPGQRGMSPMCPLMDRGPSIGGISVTAHEQLRASWHLALSPIRVLRALRIV